MKIDIPCNECLVLAVCKHKITLKCELLYDYMDECLDKQLGYKAGIKQYNKARGRVWEQLIHHFRKVDEDVIIKSSVLPGFYLINKRSSNDFNLIMKGYKGTSKIMRK